MWHLLDILFPPRVDEIVVRETRIDDFLALSAPRLVSATRPGTSILLPFSEKCVRSAIHEAKYHGSDYAFTLLSLVLTEYLIDSDEQSPLLVIVPVPLGEKRYAERGYNQVYEITHRSYRDLLAKGFAHLTLAPTILRRTRETLSQVSLPREKREENIYGAFSADFSKSSLDISKISNYTYIIIDDVLTTGATLQACVDALYEAGARKIIPLALAH